MSAVFLSYASQDAAAARRICDSLRAAGLEVWFDQSELVGGDAWDQKIRGQIKACALFVPLISTETQARREGYFRLEWKLAAQRTHTIADGTPFLLPVVIDTTRDADALVPEEFRAVQWTRLIGGGANAAFVARVKNLLTGEIAQVGSAVGASFNEARGRGSATHLPNKRSPFALTAGAFAIVVAIGTAWFVSKKSERSAVPVQPAASIPSPAPQPAAPAVSDKSIAVLPFANMSDEKDSAFFSDGIQEDVLTNLGSVRDLHVVSRTSVEQFRKTTKPIRQIGEELRVAYVLEGSVRRAGGKVRVTGQLIHAATDEHVWAKSYDRDLTDIFAVQTELAHDIALALSAALSPQEKMSLARRPTENVAAYELYLKAREWREKKSGSGRIVSAISLLQQAVELDPKFAVAWAELGDCHAHLVFDEWDRTEQRLASARAAIETAVRLAPDDPGVIAKLGVYYLHADRDYARATEQYVRLAQIRPNDPEVFRALGSIQVRQGRLADCVANLRRALELDPGNFAETRNLVSQLEAGHHYDEAEALARRLVTVFPDEQDGYFFLASTVFKARGSTAEMDALGRHTFDPNRRSAIDYLRITLARFRGDMAEAIRLDRQQPVWDGGLSPWAQDMAAAITLVNAGELTAARARLTTAMAVMNEKKEKEPLNSWLFAWLGQAHALLGEKAEALACAQRSLDILPESRDAIYGVENAVIAASTYAWVGEKERALAEFARLLKTPHGTNSFTAARGLNDSDTQVSFKPLWDDPRFQALVADPKNNAPLF